jgi:type IV secretion system protein VirB8
MNSLENHAATIAWEDSITALRDQSEARAWKIARVSIACSVITLLALAGLVPLKQVVPYIVAVDRTTGQTEIISVGSLDAIPNQALQAKYWVTQYVRTRERYDPMSALVDYRSVRIWSGKPVYADYIKRFQGDNALQKLFGAGGGWRVTILSVGLVDEHHAVVRIERADTEGTERAASAPVRLTADVTFSFNPPILGRERDLLDNPMGFQVTDYRLDPELVEVERSP